MPTYTYTCSTCSHAEDINLSYDSRDEARTCSSCSSPDVVREFPAPAVMGTAIPDHVGRKSDSTYQKLKEASKLEVAAAGMPREKRGDINKAIRNLKRADKK